MKRRKKIINWILLSLFCQLALLFYLDFYFLNRQGEATTTLIPIPKMQNSQKTQTIEVPQNANNIKASFDNTFISYILDGKIEIKKIKDNKIIKTLTPSKNDKITCYEWLHDRNTIIYSIKAPDSEAGRVQVITYNIDTEIDHIYPKITGIPAKSTINYIDLSPVTNVIYTKISTGGGNAKLYKYNVMSELFFVMNISDKSVLREFMYENKMVYRDDKYKLFLWDGDKSTSKPLQYNEKLDLLGIYGLDDVIYTCTLSADGKAKEILYGTYNKSINTWNKLEVKASVAPDNLFITTDGNVYELIADKNIVYNLKNGDKISYKGSLLEIFGNHMMTREANKVKLESLDNE